MREGGSILTCSLLVLALVLSAGCVSSDVPGDPAATPRQMSQNETPVAVAPSVSHTSVPAAPSGPAVTGTVTVAITRPVTVTATWIPKPSAEDSADDPQIVVLEFTSGYLPFDIPDCGMRTEFLEIAGDPEYGMGQPVTKLAVISIEEMDRFARAFAGRYQRDPNRIGGAECAGLPVSPTWNFILVHGLLMPRNARPAEYDIGISIRSQGRVVEQLQMNRTFILDQPVAFDLYVPIKTSEMHLFDSIEPVFSRRG